MMQRTRARLSTGIYRDASGVVIRISVKGEPVDYRRDKEGKPYKGRDLSWLRDERVRRQADATLRAERKAEAADTFGADVPRFLATISSKGHRLNSQGYMAHWETHFSDRPRHTITDLDVHTAFAAIDQANSTKTHIRRALINLYDALNGKSGYNPGRGLRNPPKDEDEVRDLPWAAIEQMFAALPPSRSKARLLLIAYIGLPQKQIAQLRPSDLRLDARELVVHPRRKGAGAAGRVMPLSDRAVAALKEFSRVEAFGTFQNRQLVETFWSGAKRAGVTWPDDARPYDLRHSFLTEVARGGADIRDIATLGMHATLDQAARYIKGAASARATNAILSVPRFSTTKKRKTLPVRSNSFQSSAGLKTGQRAKKRRRTRGKS